jgi:hypothetical protein
MHAVSDAMRVAGARPPATPPSADTPHPPAGTLTHLTCCRLLLPIAACRSMPAGSRL